MADKYDTLDALNGSARYDLGNTITEQQKFINRIHNDLMVQTGAQKKETQAYHSQQQNKLNLMLQFVNDAVSEATGEFGDLKYAGSLLKHYEVTLVIKKKKN
jgi:hypothetical protein